MPKNFSGKNIKLLMAGMHLNNVSPIRLQMTIQYLLDLGIKGDTLTLYWIWGYVRNKTIFKRYLPYIMYWGQNSSVALELKNIFEK